MSLFNRFTETVFLKEDSNLTRQIEDLKKIPDFEKNKDILRDIKLLEIGLQGEKEIAFELKNANIGMYVLHDITIIHEDLKAQIDYIIITKGFTYLVECKNLIGNITVDNKGEFKREYEINGKKYKEAIYSPYTQAVRHKEILKKRWIKNNNKLKVFLGESLFDKLRYRPLVVLANSKSLLNIKYAPKEMKDNIIRVDQLVRYINNDIQKYDSSLYDKQKDMFSLAQNFLEANCEEYVSLANKYNKISTNDNKEKYKNLLKNFRRERSKEMKIPAYYIFTDDELNNLIDKMPNTLEELNEFKLLSPVKIKCHGKEIIEILKK